MLAHLMCRAELRAEVALGGSSQFFEMVSSIFEARRKYFPAEHAPTKTPPTPPAPGARPPLSLASRISPVSRPFL